jgi:putative membrane protein
MKKYINSSYEFDNKEEIILRDYLALERTRLANERTLFAYIRTSLYLVLGGIAFLQLQGFEKIKWLGYLSLVLSIIFLVFGIFKYYQLKNKLKKYYSVTRETKKQSDES